MNLAPKKPFPPSERAIEVRVRGRVQGVGFRPNVWRIATELGLSGVVLNDSDGVLIRARGGDAALARLLERIETEPPSLAAIESVETTDFAGTLPEEFRIVASVAGAARTEIAPDAALCSDCATETLDVQARRYRYPFTNCTHCGPRLSIVTGIPYDRAQTTMAAFPLCDACRADYENPTDRRFHAEAIACPTCGPKARLVRLDGGDVNLGEDEDDVAAAARKIGAGEIVAIKGLGGYQIACDATNADAVARLRARKRRDAKPFALMARDLDVVRRFCRVSAQEAALLQNPEAPVVLLDATGPERLPDAIAPGLTTLGFMLPTTPLHLLLVQGIDDPLVMTSGNLSDEPQATDDDDARARLAGIADAALVHDRGIANRVDDSVVRVMAGAPRLIRRARGYAPAPLRLPEGFADAPPLLAFGGELKSTFCLVKNGAAVLSQHQGDLEDAATFDDYARNLALYSALFDHEPAALIADLHPEYLSSKLARERAERDGLPLIEVQHHHAHVAACLAENGVPLDAPPVLGIVLDGLGYGDDGTIWGGEFLVADYRGYRRLAALKPVAMPGGAQAVREPWRNLYAHLVEAIGRDRLARDFADLELHQRLAARPRAILDVMITNRINAPLASSCGRLFDAVAAALGIAESRQAYEGEAAARLEALVDRRSFAGVRGYAFAVNDRHGFATIEPRPMWEALLADLADKVPAPTIAARFHKGLAEVVVAMARRLRDTLPFDKVALSGGVFQNRLLFEETHRRLEESGFYVVTQARFPSNDGGLALGQAAIAAARLIDATGDAAPNSEDSPCASAFPA